MKQNWYHKNQGNGQGLIIDEATGRNVAVAYDGKDAQLLAAAPQLLDALKEARTVLKWAAQESKGKVKAEVVGGWIHHADKIENVINSIA